MGKTLDGRLAAIERTLNAPPGSKLQLSHAQLVLAVGLMLQGVEEAQASARVGPPSAIVKPGDLSHAELILAAGTDSPAARPSPPPEPVQPAPDLPPDLVRQVDAIVSEAPVRRSLTEAEAALADGVRAPPEAAAHERSRKERR